MSKGSTGYGTTAGKSSRRRILRLAGAGLTMVALGAGLTGCEDTSETGGEGSIPPPRTASPEDGGKAPEDGQAPAPCGRSPPPPRPTGTTTSWWPWAVW